MLTVILGFFLSQQVLPEGKCGHRNVLSKRQVWIFLLHIINMLFNNLQPTMWSNAKIHPNFKEISNF
jgi:hypothetical protein